MRLSATQSDQGERLVTQLEPLTTGYPGENYRATGAIAHAPRT